VVVSTPVLATLAYILSPDRGQVLLIHRDKRPDDMHYGKYLGLGGRVEADEDVVTGVRREIQEESGLDAIDVVLRGTVHWPGFGEADQASKSGEADQATKSGGADPASKSGDGWFGFVFRVDSFAGTAHEGNAEGTLAWVPVTELTRLPMWESDHHWLPMVFDDDPRQFHGIMPYHQGTMLSWSYQRA
jgi:8-oxo-dGTP diphosphatase